MPSNHLTLCHRLLLLPSVFPSIRVFANESVLHIRWPKYWSFSFSISPCNEYSVLISFRIDCFDLAIQGTLKRLLQHHSLKASILWYSAFFMVQLSHPYVTTVKTIALTIRTFVCNPMDYTVHGILQNRILEWVAFPFSRGSPNSGIEPVSPALQVDSLPAEPQGKAKHIIKGLCKIHSSPLHLPFPLSYSRQYLVINIPLHSCIF